MPLHPEGAFTGGPLFQLVGLAAARGGDPLEWQVLRMARVLRTEHWDPTWRHPLQPLASQLDHLALTFDEDFFRSCPKDAQETWLAAASATDDTVPGFMTGLAALLRLADRQGPAGHGDVPLAKWEAAARFPLLRDLDTWAYDEEYDSFESAFQGRIDGEHPCCDREVVPFVAQASEALALCAACEHFRRDFLGFDTSVTPAALALVVDLGYAHMVGHHR
ncbi:hypothetical protein [Streptomyces pristinaespiralis]|uniref:hypothetical protein n=1 Tax=Streptomyces pristinaespiralis TaxID=38300 RepID=UPI00340AD487